MHILPGEQATHSLSDVNPVVVEYVPKVHFVLVPATHQ